MKGVFSMRIEAIQVFLPPSSQLVPTCTREPRQISSSQSVFGFVVQASSNRFCPDGTAELKMVETDFGSPIIDFWFHGSNFRMVDSHILHRIAETYAWYAFLVVLYLKFLSH